MRKFFTISLMSLILVSCASTPEDYQVQINDAVKFYLASSDFLIEYNQDDKAEEFYDAIIDEFNATENEDEGFKRLLNEKVAEGNKYAKKVYFGYDKANILLSPYKLVEENVWEFEELGSEIHFTFSITSTSSKEEWTIEPNLKDIEKYMLKKYLGEEALQELRDLGMDVDSVFEATMNEAGEDEELGRGDICEDIDDAECISIRIRNRYKGLYSDKEIMSDAFYTLFTAAQQADDSEIGWPDWNCTNGLDANLSSVDVEIKSTNSAVAHVVLSYPEAGSFKKVDMPMVYENGNWFVDDIISYEDDGKFSLRESAEYILNNY